MQISMKVENLDYTLLTANETLVTSFKVAVTSAVVEAANRTYKGLISAKHVTLLLFPGSVQVQAMILPPELEDEDNEDLGENQTDIAEELQAIMSVDSAAAALGVSVVAKVSVVPGLFAVAYVNGAGNATVPALGISGIRITTATLLLITPAPTPVPPPEHFLSLLSTITTTSTTTTTSNASLVNADSADAVVIAIEVANLDYGKVSKESWLFGPIEIAIKEAVVLTAGAVTPPLTTGHVKVRFSYRYGAGSGFDIEAHVYPPKPDTVDDVHWLLSLRSATFEEDASKRMQGIDGIDKCCSTGEVAVRIEGVTLARLRKHVPKATSATPAASSLLFVLCSYAWVVVAWTSRYEPL